MKMLLEPGHIRPDEAGPDGLVNPGQVFDHPRDVAEDPHLDLDEKRAILASWASDACAVEAAPGLRLPPGGKRALSIDEILEALCDLDKQARELTVEKGGRTVRPPRFVKTAPAPAPAGRH